MKTVLVTGAATGIGKATAQLFAAEGCCVAVHYHKSKDAADALCAVIAQQGGRALAVCADISYNSQVQAMVGKVLEVFGHIDVLVNNAGTAQQKLFCDITEEEWRAMFAVNADGVFYCCRAVLPHMISRRQGCIVNISSVWGSVGASCEVHYSAAKASVIGLTRALAKETGQSGIRVNCIAPGVIDTDMISGLGKADKTELAAQTPLARLGTALDVAEAAVFLASEKAAFITGQILGVDGGFGV